MAFKPIFIRAPSKDPNGAFARGKNAIGICHRSGFKVPYKELVFEPGTNFYVHKSESDGDYSLVNHPQNFSPEKKIERIALRWSFPEVPLSLGTVVSADKLGLPGYTLTSTNWPPYVSIGTGSSAVGPERLDFSDPNNSQYYYVIFVGL